MNVINLIRIVAMDDDSIMDMKLSKIYEEHCRLSNQPKTIFIQSLKQSKTEYNEQNKKEMNEPDTKETSMNSKFDEFVEKFCIVRPDVETICKDIIGQHRLWSKNMKKEVTMAFKSYLDTRFKYTRLHNQGKDQTVYGYTGVKLIEIEHKRSLNPNDMETFIFEKCTFSQGGTILKSTLVNSFIEWKQNVKKEITEKEKDELTSYLKDCIHVLYSTVWTEEGSGQGYYGLILKSQTKHYKKSTTSKKVYKRLCDTNVLLGTWDSIAKAAETEAISNAKMSRNIKNNIKMNDYYYSLE